MTQASPLPDPASDPFGALERELRVLVRRAASNSAVIAKRMHPELEGSAYPLLAHIYMNPGTRGSDLAAHFGIGRATVSRQLARLADLGLIHRVVDPEDTRGQLITLTPDGEARFAQAQKRRTEAFVEALRDWDEADVSTLATLLRRYSDDWVAWREANTD